MPGTALLRALTKMLERHEDTESGGKSADMTSVNPWNPRSDHRHTHHYTEQQQKKKEART